MSNKLGMAIKPKTQTRCTDCSNQTNCPAFDPRMLYGFCPGFNRGRASFDPLPSLCFVGGVIAGWIACLWAGVA